MSYLGKGASDLTTLRLGSSISRANSPEGVLQVTASEFPGFSQKFNCEFRTLWTLKPGVLAVVELATRDSYLLKKYDLSANQEIQQTLRRELENLKKLKDVPNIVQAYGVIVEDPDPFQTLEELFQPARVIGIVTEYYIDGTIQDALDHNYLEQYPWHQWPLQIAKALKAIHDNGRTHLDINPTNIAINAVQEAVILDINGIGPMTPGWIAPELRGLRVHPTELLFEQGVWQDTWAFGQLLSHMVDKDATTAPNIFQHIASCLMKERSTRMSLNRAIESLNDYRLRQEELKRTRDDAA